MHDYSVILLLRTVHFTGGTMNTAVTVRGILASSDEEAMDAFVTLFMLYEWWRASSGVREASLSGYLPMVPTIATEGEVYQVVELVRLAEHRLDGYHLVSRHVCRDEETGESWEVLRLTPWGVQRYKKGGRVPLWKVTDLCSTQVLQQATEQSSYLFPFFRELEGHMVHVVVCERTQLIRLAERLGVLVFLQHSPLVYGIWQKRLVSIRNAVECPGLIPDPVPEFEEPKVTDLCLAQEILNGANGLDEDGTTLEQYLKDLRVDFDLGTARSVLWTVILAGICQVYIRENDGVICVRETE